MTTWQLLLGLVVLSVFVAPTWVGARALTGRLLSSAEADVQLLAASTVFMTLLTVPAEAVGVLGGFSRGWLLLLYPVLGVGCRLWAGRSVTSSEALPPRRLSVVGFSTGLAVAVVAAAWFVQTRASYASGTKGYDSQSYHLPFAVEMFRSGTTLPVPHLIWFLPNDFYPATSELVHAIGMVATDRDVLSPVLSVLWLVQALGAAAVAFTDRTMRLLAVLGTSAVLLMPAFYTSEAGTALADLASASYVLTALALYRRGLSSAALLGLTMGLAVGCKLSAAVPAFLLLLGLALTSKEGTRLRNGARYVLGAVLSGGFWFVRTWIATGSPLPELDLPLFPTTPHLYEYTPYGQPGTSLYQPRSVAFYLVHPDHLGVIGAAMRGGFGPLWAVEGVGVLLLCLTAIRKGLARDRVIAAIVVLGALGYLVTPESAPSLLGRPDLVSVIIETKILLPLLLAATLTIAASVGSASPLLSKAAAVVLLGVLAVELFDGGAFTAGRPQSWNHAGEAAVVLTAVLAVGALRPRVTRVHAGGLGLSLAVLLVAGHSGGESGRYRGQDLARAPQVLAALGGPSTVRVAVQGLIPSYAYWGPELDDHVTVIGHRGTHGEFNAPVSCTEFLTQLRADRSQVVVLQTAPDPTVPPLLSWIAADPGAQRVLSGRTRTVYVLRAPVSPDSCARG